MAARKAGGKSLRKRSSLLVNQDLLIDLGPDIMTASQIHGIDLTGVQYCLQTHAHADHLDTSHFLSRSPGFGVVSAPRLHFYASSASLQSASRSLASKWAPGGFDNPSLEEKLNLSVYPLETFQNYTIGEYQVIPLPANHDPVLESLIYVVQSYNKSVLYATDTACLAEDVWQSFRANKCCFDAVILDHTYGPQENTSDHLSARDLALTTSRMREEGFLSQQGFAYATHIAHEGNPPHEDLAAYAVEHGYLIAYDGLELNL